MSCQVVEAWWVVVVWMLVLDPVPSHPLPAKKNKKKPPAMECGIGGGGGGLDGAEPSRPRVPASQKKS